VRRSSKPPRADCGFVPHDNASESLNVPGRADHTKV
jgi:hypothetical protein